MTSFSLDLMEDIMCLTSFTAYHEQSETAKPLVNCWGKRYCHLPLDDIGIPAVAWESPNIDPVSSSQEGRKLAFEPVEIGKGRARILKDHMWAEGTVRQDVICPPVGDIDLDRFADDFDPIIQAECSELGTAHRVDVFPTDDDNEKVKSTFDHTNSVATWLLNNDDVATAAATAAGSQSPEYAHKTQPRRSDYTNSNKPRKRSHLRNGYHKKVKFCKPNYTYENVSEQSLQSEMQSRTSPCSLEKHSLDTCSDSDCLLPPSNPKCQPEPNHILMDLPPEDCSLQHKVSFPISSTLPMNGDDSDDEGDDDDDNGVWEKLKQIKEGNKQSHFSLSPEETGTLSKSKCYVPAGAETLHERLNGDYDPSADIYYSSEDGSEVDDIMWNGKKVVEIPMYVNSELPTSRVTFGDYLATNEKLKKTNSKGRFKGMKAIPSETQLGEEYFPELMASNLSTLEKSISPKDEMLSFNMKDLAATLLNTDEKPSIQTNEDAVENSHRDGDGPLGTLMEIDGLPADVTPKLLKDYLESFGEVIKIDFTPNSSGKVAKVYMKNTQDCEWIVSCLDGEPSPIGGDPDNCILRARVIE